MKHLLLILALLFPLTQTASAQTTPVCIKTSDGAFTGGGQGGAYDDARGCALSAGIFWGGGTDNAAVYNQVFSSTNHGVSWSTESNAIWSVRNAMGSARYNNEWYVWGGNNTTPGSGLRDSYKYTPGIGWTVISADMGASYGNTEVQFASTRTANYFLNIGGDFSTQCKGSPDLTTDSWVVRGTLPSEIQLTGGMSVAYDSVNNIVYLAGGLNNSTTTYVGKLWKSLDEGATWTEVGDLPGVPTKWSSINWTTWGLVYLQGTDGSANIKGLYYSTNGGTSWTRFKYEPSARHAACTFRSYDNKGIYIISGNFPNDAYFVTDIAKP